MTLDMEEHDVCDVPWWTEKILVRNLPVFAMMYFLFWFSEQQKSEVARFGSNSIYVRKSPHNAAIMQFAPKFHELSFCPKYCAHSSFSPDLPLQKCCFLPFGKPQRNGGFLSSDRRPRPQGWWRTCWIRFVSLASCPMVLASITLIGGNMSNWRGGRKAKVDEDDEGNVLSPGWKKEPVFERMIRWWYVFGYDYVDHYDVLVLLLFSITGTIIVLFTLRSSRMAMEMFVFQSLSNPGDWTSMLFFGARQSQASKQANRP